MESLLSFPLLLFSLILCFLICFLLKQNSNHRNPTLRPPPCPWHLPFIGNIYNIFRSLPHHAMRDLARQHGPLMVLHLGKTPTVVVSSPDAAREIMKTHNINFVEGPISTVMADIIFFCEEEIKMPVLDLQLPQIYKLIILAILTTRRVRPDNQYRSIREEEVDNLINFIHSCASHCQPINLGKSLTSLINGIITNAITGRNRKNQDEYYHALDMAVKFAAGFDVADLFPSSLLARFVCSATKKAERFQQVDEVIKERKKRNFFEAESQVEDLLTGLVNSQEATLRNLDMETVKAVVRALFGASTLHWIMLELLRNPLVMKKAQSEVREILKGKTNISESDLQKLKYLHLVIKETLRLHPVIPLLPPRQCREKCRIFDYDIAEGMTVLRNVWAIGRDEKYWTDPKEFKPERFMNNNIDFTETDFQSIPFGSGQKVCVDISFGIANVELLLASLLYHFDWKLANGLNPEKIDMSESFGITSQPKTQLLLYAIPYETDMGTQD